MALTDSVVPKLQKDGSNSYHWEAAFRLYAKSQGFRGLLDGTWEEPEIVKGEIELEPTIIGVAYPNEAALRAAQVSVCESNRVIEEQYAADRTAYHRWEAAVAALQLVILSTVPRDVYESVMNLSDVAEQFNAIVARY
jgi:hypothetical protein